MEFVQELETNQATQIKRALVDAEKAHHEYEESELQGLRDNNWARWYTNFLFERHGDVFGQMSEGFVHSQLIHSTASREQEAAQMSWEEYTTQNIIDNFYNY